MLLESQYKQWLTENPGQYLTYEDWFKQWGDINNLPIDFWEPYVPFVSDDFQIGPNGAYEHTNEHEIISVQKQLIDVLYTQMIDLSMMSKIELGDDVVAEINRLKSLLNGLEEE